MSCAIQKAEFPSIDATSKFQNDAEGCEDIWKDHPKFQSIETVVKQSKRRKKSNNRPMNTKKRKIIHVDDAREVSKILKTIQNFFQKLVTIRYPIISSYAEKGS